MKLFLARFAVFITWVLILGHLGAPPWAGVALSMIVAYLALPQSPFDGGSGK